MAKSKTAALMSSTWSSRSTVIQARVEGRASRVRGPWRWPEDRWMPGKAAWSPAYWRYVGARTQSGASGTRPLPRDFGHGTLGHLTRDVRRLDVRHRAAG